MLSQRKEENISSPDEAVQVRGRSRNMGVKSLRLRPRPATTLSHRDFRMPF